MSNLKDEQLRFVPRKTWRRLCKVWQLIEPSVIEYIRVHLVYNHVQRRSKLQTVIFQLAVCTAAKGQLCYVNEKKVEPEEIWAFICRYPPAHKYSELLLLGLNHNACPYIDLDASPVEQSGFSIEVTLEAILGRLLAADRLENEKIPDCESLFGGESLDK